LGVRLTSPCKNKSVENLQRKEKLIEVKAYLLGCGGVAAAAADDDDDDDDDELNKITSRSLNLQEFSSYFLGPSVISV
jgi:hypothetical protein